MRFPHALRVEATALVVLLIVGGMVGWLTNRVAVDDSLNYEVITGNDIEPFRSAFNASSDHVRLVLLVGPT